MHCPLLCSIACSVADSGTSARVLESDPFLSAITASLRQGRPGSSKSTKAPKAPSSRATLSSSSSDSKSRSRIDRLEGGVEAWSVGFEELSFIRLVGKGSYGRVYLAGWKQLQVGWCVRMCSCEAVACWAGWPTTNSASRHTVTMQLHSRMEPVEPKGGAG